MLKGFTLIELMIVVAIIGIIAAIGYPGYIEHVKKTKRVEAQSEILEIARKLSNYKAANYRFRGANLSSLGITATLPAGGDANYTVAITPINNGVLNAEAWTITATPINGQLNDGHVVLNSLGQRCWIKGSDKNNGTPCVPTATTNWDGK